MAHNGSMLGLWIVRDGAGQALLAKVQHEIYVLAFSSAARAMRAREAFAATGSPFLIVAANLHDVLTRAHTDGARAFILDYDPTLARFSTAHALPNPPSTAARL
ncbi:MAG TPA: hypothetical protein VF945_13935 [Polyangia bacterium]